MTGNISYLSEFEPYDGGYVSFRHGGGKITGKGIIKTGFLRPFGCHVMILNTLDHLGKFDAKGDEGYFVSVVAGTSSTNISAHMETSNDTIRNSDAQDDSKKEQDYNADVPESSRIFNPTATLKVPSADQVEAAVSLTVESEILTVSSPIPTVCLDISPESSSGPRLILKWVFSQEEAPSLGNALTLLNRFEDTFGDTTNAVTLNEVEADLSNIETSILEEPKKIFDALKDPSWVEPCKKNFFNSRFRMFRFWLTDLKGLVAQGYTQEEGINYEEVFAPIVRIEAIRLFLAYPSFMGFIVYQMDVKSAFLYGTIDEEVYVMQPPGFQDPKFPERVYKVKKAMYGLHQAPRAWYGTLSKYLLDNGFQRGNIDQTLFIKKHKGEFLLVQVYQVTPKECHLYDVKRIFGYLKGHPKLGLWYPKESPFDLVAYSDSDYGGATQDIKSTTGGCQFLGRRLISWQYKKQTIVATSTTKAECVAAASGCGQVLWIQNQMLDYGIKTTDQETKIIAIVDENNTDFHQTVDFLEASYIRIKTTDQETNIIAIVDGKPRTISESSLWRHLKLNDEEGISSLPDTELFENLSLMGYNILPSQRTVPLFASMIVTQGEGLANPTEPHHTPSPQEHQSPQSDYSPQHDSPPLSHQTIIPKPITHDLQAPTETLIPMRLTKRAIRIAQSKALSPDADEPTSFLRDDKHGEAFPTVSSLDAGQDRETIAKTSAMSHESSPRVPSLDDDEGNMQQRLHALMKLYTSLQRQQSQMADKIKDQDIEISRLKARVKSLEDKESIHIGEELGADKSTKKGSNDTEEMVNVLSLMEAVNILSSGGAAISTASVSTVDVFPTVGVPTISGSFPTEQIDAHVAREMEEEFARENQRLSEQVVRDYEIARIHAEEELKLMIEGLDRSNEVIVKHLSEYEQAEADLSVGEKIELIIHLKKQKVSPPLAHPQSPSNWENKNVFTLLPFKASKLSLRTKQEAEAVKLIKETSNNVASSFFIISSIAVQTPGSGISNLLAVGTTFTGSGNLYCQWELSPVMSADSPVTYSSVHSEARSWSIPSEDPYEEAAQQLFEQAPHSPEYVPRDHVPVFVPEFEHPEDLVLAEDEAPASLLPVGFLSPRKQPLSPRALGAEMNAIASSLYHSLHPLGTPPLLHIPLSTPSTSRRAEISKADTPPRNRPLLATPRPRCEVGESSAAAARRPGPTMAHGVDCSYVETRLRDTERRMMTALELVNMRVSCQVDVCTRKSSEFCTRHYDAQKDRAAVRAEIEVLRSERLAYEQEGIQTREALARSEAYCRALEARVAVLETHARRLEWQRQAADDLAIQHIMRTQALEAGACIDTLEDTDTIMSDSEDSTVTYTTVSSPYEGRSGDVSQGVDGPPVMPEDPYVYVLAAFQALPLPDYVPGPEEPEQAPPSPVYIPYVPELVYPEYIPSEDDVFPAEEQPLPAAASPTAESPGYIPESNPDKDPEEDEEEDQDDYPSNHDNEEEEPFGDDADEEDEEQDEDDDDEKEEHPASVDSIPPPPALHIDPRLPCHLEREDIGYGIRDTWIDPRDVVEEEALTTLEGINTRVTELTVVQEQDTQDIYRVMEDTQEAINGMDKEGIVGIRILFETQVSSTGKEHAEATASIKYCFEKTDPESIVVAASMRVLFFLSATPFSSGHDGFRCLTFLLQEVYPGVP
nr:copia protein [Tanacetum cinerariifolium]